MLYLDNKKIKERIKMNKKIIKIIKKDLENRTEYLYKMEAITEDLRTEIIFSVRDTKEPGILNYYFGLLNNLYSSINLITKG